MTSAVLIAQRLSKFQIVLMIWLMAYLFWKDIAYPFMSSVGKDIHVYHHGTILKACARTGDTREYVKFSPITLNIIADILLTVID